MTIIPQLYVYMLKISDDVKMLMRAQMHNTL
jgi:hypothetical protein